MRAIVSWAIKNSPAMNTFLIAAMLVGSVSMVIMRREVFPNFALEILLVSVPFPGATPEETEEGICQKIEAVVGNVEGVRKMTSVAQENFGYIVLELDNDVDDVQDVLNEIRSQISQISSFPPRAEDPEIRQIVFRAPAITVGILGPPIDQNPGASREEKLDAELRLRDLTEDIRNDLTELRAVPPRDPLRRALSFLFQPKGSAVSGADIVAARPYEIAVEVPEDTLRQFGMSIDGLTQILRRQNVEMPGGKMQTAGQELLLRGNNKREIGEEIANIPVLTKPNGDVVTVGDVGVVVDGFAETTSKHIINGRSGMAIRVSKTNSEDLFTIVEAVQEYVSKKEMPEGYQIVTWNNVSTDVQDRIDLLSRNGLQGLLLVFLVLAVFLELRLAFWVAIGIPVSILGAGFVLLMTGQTLNMLTMFAFLMALGIVVDDAIVIGENIYTKRAQGLKFKQAAIEGTFEVLPSVCASVATTIIAFLPLMFVSGVMGKFLGVMPVVVIAMLIISLVESTFILPAHLAHENNLFLRLIGLCLYIFKPIIGVFKFVNHHATRGMEYVIQTFYRPLLGWSLNHQPIIICSCLAYGAIAIGIILSGVAPLGMFPKLDAREISATIVFPDGTESSFAVDGVKKLKAAILEIEEQQTAAGKPPIIRNLYEKIGEIGDGAGGPTGITSGSHVGTLEVQLVLPDQRDMSSEEIIAAWRKTIPKIAGSDVLKFGSRSMGPGGISIEFKLLADDKSIGFLDAAATACKEELATIVGVNDIEDDNRPGKWEANMKLNEQGLALGLDENSLASTIRTAYFGAEVMRLQRGRHEVKLMVRSPLSERASMENLKNMRVRDSNGNEWPFNEVAEISFSRAPSEINRIDQRRSVTITAAVDDKIANSTEINQRLQATILPKVLEDFRKRTGANVSVNFEGEYASNVESVISMLTGFLIALLCMYILLTLQFRSYIQPLIILAIIPFGWLGAILGHAILGLQITLFSFFGLIALTGVVVNDSIVLVDFINRRIREGVPLRDALMSAGIRRFRPIMLTSMTTIAGLFPILLETSMQAQVLIPMAACLIFGLSTGTLLILILVPIFYNMYGTVLHMADIPLDDDPFEPDDESVERIQDNHSGNVNGLVPEVAAGV